jgi:hypothetical protein
MDVDFFPDDMSDVETVHPVVHMILSTGYQAPSNYLNNHHSFFCLPSKIQDCL